MSFPYYPPKVWTVEEDTKGGAAVSSIFSLNRPEAGARFEKALPVGKHPLQVYAFASPAGQKVNILLEELLDAGVTDAEYDAHFIDIIKGDQFGSGFTEVNPNSKIPCLVDRSVDPPLRVFESGHILLYLAEKFGKFLSSDPSKRTETLNWLFWSHGTAPLVGGAFGHFFFYAPEKLSYPINRYTMEVKRQLSVLDNQLKLNKFVAGDEFSIADISCWTYYGRIFLKDMYTGAAEFLDAESYTNVMRWAKSIECRKGVVRGRIVNKRPLNRHCADDIDEVLAKDSDS